MKKLKNAVVAATLAVASASAMASDNTILDAITTEMGG
ncbi:ATP synthase subunit K, partial [Neisseria meningitidis]